MTRVPYNILALRLPLCGLLGAGWLAGWRVTAAASDDNRLNVGGCNYDGGDADDDDNHEDITRNNHGCCCLRNLAN